MNIPTSNKQRIIVGMSGGVDSSVAALLLQQQGYAIEGLFMKNWEEDDDKEYCAAEVDLADAQAVCDRLNIPLHTVNFSHEYWDRVFEYFLAEYRSGRTPNPDVMCNKEIKFKAFLDHALTLGADKIATGHYARIQHDNNVYTMLKGLDHNKDQTYFLYALNQHQLGHALFPVGHIEKSEVRNIAEQAGFVTHDKKDSTGICFIGERRFRDFLARYLPGTAGEIITPQGQIVGEHHGLMYYTIGQRQGLEIGGVKDMPEEAWYVVGKDLTGNRLVVGQGHNHPLLLHRGLIASQLHWISGQAPDLTLQYTARIRHRQAEQTCTIQQSENDRYLVMFDEPQRAITPGQSIVFYDGDICLGGGIIDHATK